MKRTYHASAERGRAILGYPSTRELAAISDRLDRWIEATLGARRYFFAATRTVWMQENPDLDPDPLEPWLVALNDRWYQLWRLNSATCSYGGCLGPADGSECRHPREDD